MTRHIWRPLLITLMPCALLAQAIDQPSRALPETAAAALVASVNAATRHSRHVWRDTPPFNDDGTVNAYIEIARGDRNKWEFDMRANARAVDRVMPESIGGYPVNYGFVPQTVSYDGDPFDALVLGEPLPGGHVVRGAIVGLMLMEDEKGVDSKVVLSVLGLNRRARHQLDESERQRIGEYFQQYKRHETGKFSKVPGWGTPKGGRDHIVMTHVFFKECRGQPVGPCRVTR